ncbi:MAG: hypothetical protein ACK5MW_00715 [Enterococcus sp.]
MNTDQKKTAPKSKMTPKKIRFLSWVLGLLLFTLFVLSFAPIQQQIRESQLNDLVYADLPEQQLQPLRPAEIERKIHDTKAVTIMFSPPKGADYQQVLHVMNDPKQAEQLNRTIFYYPLVYPDAISQTYQLAPNEVTLVFFEAGKERNRLNVSELADFEDEFIPEVNRLPIWSLAGNGDG